MLIGELLGVAEMGRPKVSTMETFAAQARGISSGDKDRFRALASHADLVKRLLADGVTKRKPIHRK